MLTSISNLVERSVDHFENQKDRNFIVKENVDGKQKPKIGQGEMLMDNLTNLVIGNSCDQHREVIKKDDEDG